MEPHKTYLGDGAYVALDALGDVVLTTENGIETTNRVVLEPEVLAALLLFVATHLPDAIKRVS